MSGEGEFPCFFVVSVAFVVFFFFFFVLAVSLASVPLDLRLGGGMTTTVYCMQFSSILRGNGMERAMV